MFGRPEITSIERGCAIIEETIQEKYEEVRSSVSEIVEPFIEGLPQELVQGSNVIARNLIVGIDREKADEPRALRVATRTLAVSQLVICKAFTHEPTFKTGELIDTYIELAYFSSEGSVDIYSNLCQALNRSTYFGAIMRECQPSIDPMIDEPEVFQLFGGLILQSAALGEASRSRAELEAAATRLSNFDGDLWELFDETH